MRLVNEKYVEGAAYHEAGHIVVAVVQGLALRKGGLRIDERGAGLACYKCKQPDGSTNVGPDHCRERTILAILAGQIAHGRFYEPVANGDANASDDFDRVDELLLEMYSDNDARRTARNQLCKRSKELVEEHWGAIEGLAKALWAKNWSPKVPEAKGLEKRMEGAEVVTLLRHYGISAAIDES
jgi:hypothetical protein